MFRFPVLLVGALSVAVAADLSGECRTALGIPCHTLEREVSVVRVFRDGLSDLGSYWFRETRAVRRDGSFLERREYSGLSLGGFHRSGTTEFLDVAANRFYRIEQAAHRFTSRPPLMPLEKPHRRSRASNTQCEPGALGQGSGFRRVGGARTMFGWRVVHWYAEDAKGGLRHLWYAPDLDCQLMRSIEVQRNRLRLPVSVTLTRVIRVSAGEPPASLFTVPDGYRQAIDSRSLTYAPPGK